jgi:hypothetical protein
VSKLADSDTCPRPTARGQGPFEPEERAVVAEAVGRLGSARARQPIHARSVPVYIVFFR